ncbi:sulfatase-like hydrolase/transferase [Devosia sp. PTR5]|uniref:Sulfatase-like hydrolase/transferase n=1 Tax=Devosia oryzisoli TaxID=2774138 RepID=A0A927FXB2_9HYPH|nr:sulfatase-like hydrolase/transferase [Devosia oryzisoli]
MSSDRPHIILVMTDQQRFDTIRALGASHMHTPNLDRLVREGISFDNCFINAPSCVPSRAALFSGYSPHTSGVLRNGQQWGKTWVSLLADAGYHCVNVGKMHTIPYDAPAGFHERFVVENKDRFYEGRWYADEWDKALVHQGATKPSRAQYRTMPDYTERLGAVDWPLADRQHADVFVAETALWWLETRPRPEALFMQIGLPGPHPPYDPPARYAKAYLDNPDLPVPQVTAAELDGLPASLKAKRMHDIEVDHDAVSWSLEPTREQLRRLRAHYDGNVTLIDEQIGRLLETLETTGYLDNCVVIFMSDHGDNLGEHGLSQKWSMYDSVTRVPAIVWAPGRFAGGRRLEQMCQLFDFGPTILDLAGVAPPPDMEAQSLLPALEGAAWQGRAAVFCEQVGDVAMANTRLITMVRTPTDKAVLFLGADDGQYFDLVADPVEVHNLWHDPAAQPRLDQLRRMLLEWRLDSSVHTMDRGVAVR